MGIVSLKGMTPVVTTKPRVINHVFSLTSDTSFYNILDILGEGKLHRFSMRTSGINNNFHEIRITVDGNVSLLNSSTISEAIITRSYSDSGVRSDIQTGIVFTTSLKIEVRKTSSNSGTLNVSADYSLV